jgi:hypothetical protein
LNIGTDKAYSTLRETAKMIKGKVVKVKLYGGEIAERRVLSDKGSVVVICSESEYREALEEDREPSGLGFPREDVLMETLRMDEAD